MADPGCDLNHTTGAQKPGHASQGNGATICAISTDCHLRPIEPPAWSGRAGRVAALEWLIRQMRAEPNVWWATCGQVAAWQTETNQNADVRVRFPDGPV